jgi:hypothetical protein
MAHLTDHPLWIFLFSCILLTISAWLGTYIRRRRHDSTRAWRDDLGIVEAATLTLLGLIIGFSFSMAVDRYNQRKNYEEEEANAIGTEYLRAGLLPAAEVAKVRGLLVNYLDQRVLFYTATDEPRLRQIDAQTDKLQTELWSLVQAAGVAQPTPVVALVVAGMNDVLNSRGYAQAAWWNRIPVEAWAMMMAIAICANLLFGCSAKDTKVKPVLLLVLPLIVSIAFLLIADIESPRKGFIRVIPQNLLTLSQSLHLK